MSNQTMRPKWWQVYAMLVALLGLFWLEAHARLTGTDHVLAELGILVLIFGSLRAWLKANRAALMESDPTEAGWGVGICDIPAAEEAEDEPGRQGMDAVASAGIQAHLKDDSGREDRKAASGGLPNLRFVSRR